MNKPKFFTENIGKQVQIPKGTSIRFQKSKGSRMKLLRLESDSVFVIAGVRRTTKGKFLAILKRPKERRIYIWGEPPRNKGERFMLELKDLQKLKIGA
jgi:predicted AAA+ superfamily ATPase